MKKVLFLVFAAAFLVLAGCKPKPKEISQLERKKGANFASEAQFAMTMRDYPRAEGLLAQAAQQCPDDSGYWIALGQSRILQNNKAGAKEAYTHALDAVVDAAKQEPKEPEHYVQQIGILALLGQPEKARVTADEMAKKFPDDLKVRQFISRKEIDQMLADPTMKRFSVGDGK